MTLKEMIIEYRKSRGLSQRQFASMCGLSNAYISMIEKEIDPKTGQRNIPSLITLNKIAAGMSMTIDQLLAKVDDMPVSLKTTSTSSISAPEWKLIRSFRELNDDGQTAALKYIDYLCGQPEYIKSDNAGKMEKEA